MLHILQLKIWNRQTTIFEAVDLDRSEWAIISRSRENFQGRIKRFYLENSHPDAEIEIRPLFWRCSHWEELTEKGAKSGHMWAKLSACKNYRGKFKRGKRRQWATKLSQIILLMELLPASAAHVITGGSETLAITSWPAPNEVQSSLSHNRLSDCFLLSLESFFPDSYLFSYISDEHSQQEFDRNISSLPSLPGDPIAKNDQRVVITCVAWDLIVRFYRGPSS